jgi:hypothetical protein
MRARVVDVDRIGRTTLALTGVAAAVALVVSGGPAALSVVVGGAVVAGNLSLIRAIVSRLIARSRRTGQGVALVVMKLALTILLVGAAFSGLSIEPVPFSIGVSTLLVAVIIDVCFLGTPVAPD